MSTAGRKSCSHSSAVLKQSFLSLGEIACPQKTTIISISSSVVVVFRRWLVGALQVALVLVLSTHSCHCSHVHHHRLLKLTALPLIIPA